MRKFTLDDVRRVDPGISDADAAAALEQLNAEPIPMAERWAAENDDIVAAMLNPPKLGPDGLTDALRRVNAFAAERGLPLPFPPAPPAWRFDTLQVPLAGFEYHAGESVWDQLAEGAALDLVREPASPHDENAIRVDWAGHKLGYVPRADNAALAALMDLGVAARATIARLRESHSPWERILMDLRIDSAG